MCGEDDRPTVAVLIPARDEAESLPRLLRRLDAPGLGLERIVVVDNGSEDETAEVARRSGATVVVEPAAGYGRACQRGIAHLAETGPPEVVVFLDADDYEAAGQLAPLLAPIRSGRADLVVGVRRSEDEPGVRWHAAIGNRLILAVLRGAYGDRTRDMGPFRAIRWGCLRDLRLDDPNFGWYVQMQVRALRAGYRVTSVPVAFRRRVHGRSKVSGSVAGSIRAGWVMIRTLAAEIVREPPERRGR